jgi:methyl-accepting chemotaxis protein
VRIPLSQKSALGAVLVGCTALFLPGLLEAAGILVSPGAVPMVGLLGSAALGYWLARSQAAAARALRDAAQEISRGRLGVDFALSAPHFRDEISELGASMREMAGNLSELLVSAQGNANSVTETAQDLLRAVDRLGVGNREIASTVTHLSDSVAEQQRLLLDANQLIHEMAATIEQNAARAREAFGFAAEATQKAASGVDITRLAIQKMRTVFERVEQVVARVFELEEKTRHVHQITEMITEVAHRTNLLSLNASIEAARAGEAGRGFSVVAEEIRKLAESAGSSAEEIAKLVDEIQTGTGEVADQMRESRVVVGEGREDVDTIASSLEQIRSAVGEAAGRSEEIFEGADAQARDVERIVSAMDALKQVESRNAQALVQVTATAGSQESSMERLREVAGAVAAKSEALQANLRRVDTGRAPAERSAP